MIKHIVLWNVRGDTPEERAQGAAFIKACFEGIAPAIPGLLHLEVGIDTSGIDYACDLALYTEFESQAALDAYAIHPAHLRVKAELGDLRIARHQVDYAAPDAN